MVEVDSIDPKMLYFIGIFVILLILILVSFVLTSKRAGRLEQSLEEIERRMDLTDQTLVKLQQSISSLAASQSAFTKDDDDDVALQAITDLSSKFTKLNAECENAFNAQVKLRNELQQLKDQVDQNSVMMGSLSPASAMSEHMSAPMSAPSQYSSEFDSSNSFMGANGQSILPPHTSQRSMNPNAASGLNSPVGMPSASNYGNSVGMNPYGSNINGGLNSSINGSMNHAMNGGMNGGLAGGLNGGMNPALNGATLPSNARRGNMGGSNFNPDDSGIFMPPRAADPRGQDMRMNDPNAAMGNPSETSSLQGMVGDSSLAVDPTAQSSYQSKVEQRSATTGFMPDDEGFSSIQTDAQTGNANRGNADSVGATGNVVDPATMGSANSASNTINPSSADAGDAFSNNAFANGQSSNAKNTKKDKGNDFDLPSMSIMADMSFVDLNSELGENIEPPAPVSKNKGVGSGVVEVNPEVHAIAKKLDPTKALNSQQAQAKAQGLDPNSSLAQDLSANSLSNSLSSNSLSGNSLSTNSLAANHVALDEAVASKLSPSEEAALAAVNSVDESALMNLAQNDFNLDFNVGNKEDENLASLQPTPQDDERFAALNNFSNLYANARKKQLEQERQQAGLSPIKRDDEDRPSHTAVQDLDASEHSLSSILHEEGSTIDFGQNMHFDKFKPAERSLSQESDRTRTEAVVKAVAETNKRKQPPMPEVMSPGVLQKATVVDMIYDEEYVRKQKDQKPYGINIDTLDKAHTFIDAGVPLVEISAKTGLSEDELRLLYDVDEDGKVRNSGDMFKENSALDIMHGQDPELMDESKQESERSFASGTNSTKTANANSSLANKSGSKSGNKLSNKSSKAGKSNSLSSSKGSGSLTSDSLSPSAVLDKDERKEIESIMQDKSLDLAQDKSSSGSLSLDNMDMEAIDQFADDLIKTHKDQDRKLAKDNGRKSASLKSNVGNKSSLKRNLNNDFAASEIGSIENSNTKITKNRSTTPIPVILPNDLDEPKLSNSQDPLNILDDFNAFNRNAKANAKANTNAKNASKAAAYSRSYDVRREPSGTGSENLAANNAEYLKNFNADLNSALDDDEVTLQGKNVSKAGGVASSLNSNNRQDNRQDNRLSKGPNQSLNKTARSDSLQGGIGSTSLANGSGTTSTNETNHGIVATQKVGTGANAGKVIKHYGKPRSEKGIGSISSVGHETYEQSQNTERYARNAMQSAKNRGQAQPQDALAPKKITVDMALAQMDGDNKNSKSLKGSKSNSAPLGLGSVHSTGSFSAVSAMNPGMSDVVNMAPMGIGSVENETQEDPSSILNQVVKGGLRSVASSITEDQLDPFAQGSNTMLDQTSLPVEPTKVKPGQHYANRKARNAYGMTRQA